MITAKQALEVTIRERKSKLKTIDKMIADASKKGFRETTFSMPNDSNEAIEYIVEQLKSRGFNVVVDIPGGLSSYADLDISW